MVQFYEQLSSLPLDNDHHHRRASPEMEHSLDISFDADYQMKGHHKRGQVDTMAQCVFDDLGRPSMSNPAHTYTSCVQSPGDDGGLGEEIALNEPATTTTTPPHHRRGKASPTRMATSTMAGDDTEHVRWTCDAIHGFIRDRSSPYKSTHFLSISSTTEQSPMLDIALRAAKSFARTHQPAATATTTATTTSSDGVEGVQQIFTVFEGDERVRVQVVEDEDMLYFKQRSLEHSLVVLDAQLPSIDVTLTKAIYDSLITMGAHLSVWQPPTHRDDAARDRPAPSDGHRKPPGYAANVSLDFPDLEQSYLEQTSMTSDVSSVYYEAYSTTSGTATIPATHPMAGMLRIGHGECHACTHAHGGYG
ncbi:hypothetical protein SYNPS1DRAFT_31436 [Syncephalis pseudoplumigaleata]|uniref:Uncharacterized protein n=1 Tax=Syncephalis pseudoplumigaleata TaxID=1712513 RepID=A0A4P9YVE4_9FUNG|nr:hypothetical protein SYNPS1DRAFT_31436 [Syncephalis pseudoplumigaleata]|eukprot:RKP22890.1 hypothetical protein SYNPS1DRAFT_31436 [Syncephalis pseudoplumigaleata]